MLHMQVLFMVEREWSQFRFADIGQRYGFNFLQEQNGIGRRPPTEAEKPAFWVAAAKQMKDIYEANVTISRKEGHVHRPSVNLGAALTRDEIADCEYTRKFIMKPTRQLVCSSEYATLKVRI